MKNKNIIFNNTLEKYNKRYRHHKNLLKVTKKEVEEFDELYNAKGEHRLLKHNNWWLIGDTYYQAPKVLHHYWFRNLNAGVQTAICLLGAGVVATGVTLPFVLNNVKKDAREDIIIDPSKEKDAKIEVLEKTSEGVYYKISPIDSSKKKATGIESVFIGNDKLIENTEYTYSACNKTESNSIKLLIKQVAFSSHSGPIKVLPKVEELITVPVSYDEDAISEAGFILEDEETELKERESVSFRLTNDTENELTFDLIAKVNDTEVYRTASSKILADGETQSYSIKSSEITEFESLTKEDTIVITVELKTTSIHTNLETSNLFLKPGESKNIKILNNNNKNITSSCSADGFSSDHLDAQKEGTGEDCEYVFTAKTDVKGSYKDTIKFKDGDLECSINVTYAKTIDLSGGVSTCEGITAEQPSSVCESGEDIQINVQSTLTEYKADITIKDANDNMVFEDYVSIKNGPSSINLNNTYIDWKNVYENKPYKIYISGLNVDSIHPDIGAHVGVHAKEIFIIKILNQGGDNVSNGCTVSYDQGGEDKLSVVKDEDNNQFVVTVVNSYTMDDSTHLYFTYGNGQIRTSIFIEFVPRELNIKFNESLVKTLDKHKLYLVEEGSTSSIKEYDKDSGSPSEIKIKFDSSALFQLDTFIHLYIKDEKGNLIEDYGTVCFSATCKPVTIKFTTEEYSKTYHNQDIYIYGDERF